MGKVLKQWYKEGDRGFKITFYITQSISLILILISFFIPPVAVVDSSVFAAIGELAFFPTLYSFYMIMSSGRKASIQKGETTLSVEGDNVN